MPKSFGNVAVPGLAKGGPVMNSQSYIVGEKGPERLTMFPDGTGWVTPHSQMNRLADGIHRYYGGPVGGPPVGGTGTLNLNQGNPVSRPAPGYGMPPKATPSTITPGTPAAAPPPPFGAQSNNPLITGGSPTPIQNTPYSQWSQPFQAPTLQQAENYPGYQFQLQQGEQALANQASASGELGDSNYGRALTNYAENAATQDYGQVYNQALGQYQQNYNIFENNQNQQFNRLASLAGIGQTSTNQLGGSLGQAANTNAGILGQASGQIGQQLNNAGAATASGYVGQANAWGGALGNVGNAAQLPLYMQYLNQNQGQDLTSGSSLGPAYYGTNPGQGY